MGRAGISFPGRARILAACPRKCQYEVNMSARLVGLAAVAIAWAADQPGVTIRTTTTLVQVGVVARDSKGRTVEGLKKEDFEVLDNGKAQTIAVFYGENASGPAAVAAAVPAATPQ